MAYFSEGASLPRWQWNEETGNFYYGARYYDPKISVWLSVDPKAHWYPNFSPYAYVLNNPVNLTDPTGMSATCPDCPDGQEYDFFRNSPNQYNYDKKTNEITRQGGALDEVTVIDNVPSNTNPQDNTQVVSNQVNPNTHYIGYRKGGKYGQEYGEYIYGKASRDVLKMPDARHVGGSINLPDLELKDPEGDVRNYFMAEFVKEIFKDPSAPTDDSVMTYWPNNNYGFDDTVPMVRPYLNSGGVGSYGRPGTAKDTLNKSTEAAKEFFR